ncbi:hypothetical protein R1flu_007952 [Riccia fluitans]|uniref:Uncharacterized protein n=1 Tax=Riccia fluitans TaxID=41844 RepID=A0ABD1XE08_9MARC
MLRYMDEHVVGDGFIVLYAMRAWPGSWPQEFLHISTLARFRYTCSHDFRHGRKGNTVQTIFNVQDSICGLLPQLSAPKSTGIDLTDFQVLAYMYIIERSAIESQSARGYSLIKA